MSTEAPNLILAQNVTEGWIEAFRSVHSQGSRTPLLISFSDTPSEEPFEIVPVREALDKLLVSLGKNSIDVTALTVFPYQLWLRKGKPGLREFSDDCLRRLLPRLKALDRRNQNGTYFERMMAYSGWRRGATRTVNQLEHVVSLLNRPRTPRESALQIGCFDPAKDHTGQPVRGFPCLQQVSVSCGESGQLGLTAIYPTQYIFDRAYGNYLSLLQLGRVIAHLTRRIFVRLNCYIGKPILGDVRKRDLRNLHRLVENFSVSLNGREER